MSYESTKAVNLIAGEDLRGEVYALLTVENDGGVCKVVRASAATQTAVGILAENPRSDISTDGQTVPVVLLAGGGRAMVRANGTITANRLVIASAVAGRVTEANGIGALAADTMAIGIALESAVGGDVFEVLLQPMTSATET